ncbi:MAG: hypothetical protein FJ297_19090 [Planctomycetes bacterium]|nr:hypothetical protein [Planctomycetota bacterium]
MTRSLNPMERELRKFAVALIERRGGVVDWPDEAVSGSAVVPEELASECGFPGDAFRLDTVAAPGTLAIGLGGEFLDLAARALDGIPRDGAFLIPERYLTRRDLSDKVAQAFVWHNARAKAGPAEPALVAYHAWTFIASLRTEEMWESVIEVSVNAESRAVVEMPDLFLEPDLIDDEGRPSEPPSTYDAAVAEGKRAMNRLTTAFLNRVDARLERDRKRIRDYYRALAREAKSPRRRGAPVSEEQLDAQSRAVDLELRRKLAELSERYAVQARLRPTRLARFRIPALVIPLVVQRKQATREYRLYWNVVLRRLEPLACSRCFRSTYSASFTNDSVDLVCTACSESAEGPKSPPSAPGR